MAWYLYNVDKEHAKINGYKKDLFHKVVARILRKMLRVQYSCLITLLFFMPRVKFPNIYNNESYSF